MSDWISVEDRLPQLYVDVLVYTGEFVVVSARLTDNEWRADKPTHWMPLPKSPSED